MQNNVFKMAPQKKNVFKMDSNTNNSLHDPVVFVHPKKVLLKLLATIVCVYVSIPDLPIIILILTNRAFINCIFFPYNKSSGKSRHAYCSS